MFETALEEKLKKIFKVEKVSFSQPGESREQGCIFVEIENSRNAIKDGRQIARVSGNVVMFGPAEKLKFGFFSKAINAADSDDTKDLFFFDFETNTKLYQNLVQRGFSFVYFFNGQYDPDLGTLTSVNFEET